VDFVGGDKLTLRYDASKDLDMQKVRRAIEAADIKDFLAQRNETCIPARNHSKSPRLQDGPQGGVGAHDCPAEMKFEQLAFNMVGPPWARRFRRAR